MNQPVSARVTQAQVFGLFGLYSHRIPLHAERVTVIHGPNGVGKTAILGLIDALFHGDFARLRAVPFGKLLVSLSDGRRVDVRPALQVIRVYRGEQQEAEADLTEAGSSKDAAALGLSDVAVRMIRTDRLRGAEGGLAVEVLAERLRIAIQEALSSYATRSQALDQSFPQRMVAAAAAAQDAQHVAQRLADLEAHRTSLRDLNLLDPGDAAPFDPAQLPRLTPAQIKVLALYVHDAELKLGVLAPLAARLALLRDSLNHKFVHKQVRIDRDRGLVLTGYDGRDLPLAALSSGEQHQVVMWFDLLFATAPGTLVLIDEPELSLHIAWQKQFLDDLLRAANLVRFDALVATHSPFIVGDRSDILVPLVADIG